MREKLLIYGIGSLGEKIYEYNKRDGIYDIVGFIDDKQNLESEFCGVSTMNYNQFKQKYSTTDCKLFVAIGYVKCNYYRELVCNKVIADGYDVINYISPNAICWNGTLFGKNIFVADNVFIGHGSRIMDGVILYEGCTLSHDAEIGAYSFLSLRVAFGGYTKLGRNSFVGLNTTVKDDVKIGDYNIVGCGTNVIHSTEAYNVTIGNPGRSQIKDTTLIKI